MAPQLHHFGLTVSDLERSVEWYCTNLGLELITRARVEGEKISEQTGLGDTVIDVALLRGSNCVLELLCYQQPVGQAYSLRTCDAGAAHLCIVVSDIEETVARMGRNGVLFHARVTQLVGRTKMVYVRDPDGVMVELLEPKDELDLSVLCGHEPVTLSQTGGH